MEFVSERAALTSLSETLIKAGVSLFNGVKYIHSLSAEDFYQVSFKDCLKVLLNNIADADCLQSLSLRITPDRCDEMSVASYETVLPLMVYSFAVRIPILKSVKVPMGNSGGQGEMSDDQLRTVFDLVTERGALPKVMETPYIKESFQEIRTLVKKNRPIPPYTAEWFKGYVKGEVPSLAAINNRNLFLMGAVEVLFPMFYRCLEEELKNVIIALART